MIQAMATVMTTPVTMPRQDRMLGLRWRSLGNKISHHGCFGYSQVVRTRTNLAARAVSTTPTRPRPEGLTPLDQERISQLNGLLEEIVRTAISTGPRSATRFGQGVEAVLTVGSEYLSQQLQGAQISSNARAPFTLDPPGPAQLHSLFERLGATYLKLGQFIASASTLFPADYVKEFQCTCYAHAYAMLVLASSVSLVTGHFSTWTDGRTEGRKEPAFVLVDVQTDGRKEGNVVPVEPSVAPPAGHRSGFMYRSFIDFAVEELSRRPDVSPVLLKEEFRNMTAQGVNDATIDNQAFTSSKIRMFRIASIDTGPMQVLNVAGFARPDYDLPIFCADFFSVPKMNIIVLDLNPLYNTDLDKGYKERFYTDLLPLANKYIELLPWGDKLTGESLQFFSPIVLWTKPQTEDVGNFLYPAFRDYLQAWLNMVDSAQPAVDPVAIAKNQEAQHRYISWRTTKDPGRPLLTKLYGEQLAESYIKEFLFSGHSSLGTKSFLDYFPQYRAEDGSIFKQRSMAGRSFETRPWDKDGNFSVN